MDNSGRMEEDSDSVVDISNGTCYSNINTKANGKYIPCGNVATGLDWACCAAGDLCMSSSACYHSKFDITYLAGCTDPQFKSPSCQNKGEFANQPWVGLERCDPLDDTWGGCEEKGKGDMPGSSPPAKCTCFPDTQLFVGKPKLDFVAQLPVTMGGTISWGQFGRPTIPPAAERTSTSAIPTMFTTSGPSVTTGMITSDPSMPTDATNGSPAASGSPAPNTPTAVSSLPTAALAGIGVGIGVGAVLLGCIFYLTLLLRKRKNTKSGNIGATTQSDLPPAPNSSAQPPSSTNEDPMNPAFSGYKSELPANELNRGSSLVSYSNTTSPASSYSQAQFPHPSQIQYQAYNPNIHGNYAAMKWGQSTGGVNPVYPFSPESVSGPQNPLGVMGPPPQQVIYELEG
ncbi:hypothetical protein AAE478_006869 [Parahypoxylon ruwenzoriense]